MKLSERMQVLEQKVVSYQEGIRMLEDVRAEVQEAMSTSRALGLGLLLGQVFIITANIILNASQVRRLDVVYQAVAKLAYEKFGRSGRHDSSTALTSTLDDLVKEVLAEVKRRGATEWVPVVNVAWGLFHDVRALIQHAELVENTAIEQRAALMKLEQSLRRFNQEIVKLQIKKGELFNQAALLLRTA